MAKDKEKDDWVDVPHDDWQDVPIAPIREKTSPAGSALAGLSQGATFGFGDELSGGLNAAADKLYDKIMGDDTKPFIQRYREWRDMSRRLNAQAEKDNPKTYLGGNIAGAVVSPASKVLAPVKGAGLVANAGRIALGGAVAGAGNSSADATKSLEGVKQLAKDTAIGAGTNLAVSGALAPVGYFAKKLSPAALSKVAEERAVKAAIGQNTKAFSELNSSGRLNDAGRQLLGDAENPGLMGWFSNSEDILPNVQAKKADIGQQIGTVGTKIDELSPGAIKPQEIVDELKKKLAAIPEVPDTKQARNYLQEQIKTYENMGLAEGGLGPAKPMTFENVQKNKEAIKYSPVEDPNKINAANETYRTLGESQENAAKSLSENASPEVKDLLGKYEGLKSEYGPLKSLSKYGQKKVEADLSKRFISPSDYGAAWAEMIRSGVLGPKAALMAAANKQVRERGSAFAAKSMDKLSQLMASNPAGLNQFRGVLEDAATRGPQSLAVTHMLLSNNPEYRKLLEVEK